MVTSWSLMFLLPLLASISSTQGACRFPESWSGSWFQSGVTHLLHINTTRIETKGACIENDGDKYIVEERSDNCFRCVVIHEKHHNVLQYKETFCSPRIPLDQLCGEIAGDAALVSMYRSDAAPVACPFKGPFSFTYNRGSGECARPVSRVDSCIAESRLRLRYQACADVLGSESSSEELQCLAVWKDGNTRYLVGKLSHKMATTDEDRYRCFVYDKFQQHGHPMVYHVAQSGDATCNGLLSSTEGSRTMKLTKETHSSQCRYPTWVTEHHHWHTLDYRRSYQFNHKNATLRISNDTEDETAGMEMRVACHQQVDVQDKQVTLIAHVTVGCESGYVCMVFYRRDGHVIELQQTSNFAHAPDEACHPNNFNVASLPFITLITASLKPRKCPYLGRYTVTGVARDGARQLRRTGATTGASRDALCADDFESLAVGCRATDTMEFHSSCSSESVSAYSCHGSWEDNGTNYLIASPLSRKSTGARRYCFIYTENDKSLQFSSITDTCLRNINPGVSGIWAFNVTVNGHCAESNAMESGAWALTSDLLMLWITLSVASLTLR